MIGKVTMIFLSVRENEFEENHNVCPENNPGSSHNEVFECLEMTIKWVELQKNTDPIQLIHLR